MIQSDRFNNSGIGTVICAAVTTNLNLATAPGNVLIHPDDAGLPETSVVNVSQPITVDRRDLLRRAGTLPFSVMEMVDEGLRLALAL